MKPLSGGRLAAYCLLVFAVSVGPAAAQTAFRGVWADAFHQGFKSIDQINTLIQRAVAGNYNALVVEVLAYQDNVGGGHGAYWNSAIVPKATDISGGIDPLAELCTRAHAQGLEVHAWLVTYRISTSWPPTGNATLAGHPEWFMVPRASTGGGPALVAGKYVLDPGSPDVQNYLVTIVRELATNYPIDGINWDYIRYEQTDAGYPSSNSYYDSGLKRFQRITGRSDLPATTDSQWSDFRRRTISELVRRCRAEIPWIRTNPRQPVRHTADVFATGYAPASFTSSDAYNRFQDWRLWMEMGWLDAAMPMNYKREHCSSQAAMYRTWIDAAINWRYQRHVYCGQGNYLNSQANSKTQLEYVYSRGANGSMNYSYWATNATETICETPSQDPWENDPGWYSYIASQLFTTPAALPTMPWRDAATATEGTVWGRVRSWDTGEYLDDAKVQVDSSTSVQTDGNGYYTITLIPATSGGTAHTLTASKNGQLFTHPAAIVFAGDIVRYDFLLGGAAPMIGLSADTISHTIDYGQSLPADVFTVSALEPASRGPVNYTISVDVPWLAVSPRQDTASGEDDAIRVSFDTAGLSVGNHSGTITVADAAATNNPQTVLVSLTVRPISGPGDFDRDFDVDQDDFSHIQRCLTGTAVPQTDPACTDARMDDDSDVDQIDVELFMQCLSGANVLSDPGCLNN